MASPKLDLIFPPVSNLNLLAIMDISFYPTAHVINTPTVEITPPGFRRVVQSFSPSNLNLYNSANLSITCPEDECGLAELPDGIWTVKYSIAPVSTTFVEKTFIRVDALKARFEKVFLSVDMKECDFDVKGQDMEKIDQIEAYIQSSIAEANQCNNIAAMKRYSIANKLIDNFLKTK